MSVIWKRINDTGKNWRHVYKALIVLDYLVANGSERVIDEIREHAYQISTLSDFQYIDSSGRDQGNNVRKKSQILVILVNDKDRILEARQKAEANREKFRSTSAGGMYKPNSNGGYGDRYDDREGRYAGSRDDGRNGNGNGREREYGYNNRDDDRYGRYSGDSYNREGDRYGRDSEERYSYRDDDYNGRGSEHSYRSRSRNSDRERSVDDDGQSSSRRLERKFSEQNIGAPPSYEDAVGDSQSQVQQERNGGSPVAAAPTTSSPHASNLPRQETTGLSSSASPKNQDNGVVDEFDPRSSFAVGAPASNNDAPAVPVASNKSVPVSHTASTNVEVDLLGSLSDAFDSNPLALVPTTSTSEPDTSPYSTQTSSFPTSQSTNSMNQPFDDPFGDGPFKAISTSDTALTQQTSNADPNAFGFGESLSSVNYSTAPVGSNVRSPQFQTASQNSQFPSTSPNTQFQQPASMNPQFQPSTSGDFFPPIQVSSKQMSLTHQEPDILADILPPAGPSPVTASQPSFSTPNTQNRNMYAIFHPPPGSSVVPNMAFQTPHGQPGSGGFFNGGGSMTPASSYMPQTLTPQPAQLNGGNFLSQPQINHQTVAGPAVQHNNDVMGNLFSPNTSSASQQQPFTSSAGPLAIVPAQPKDKFETKSTVWADTLSRGLVNLNISGSKINPMSDIGIDFEAINRKEKRMEKQPAGPPPASTTVMGKAMGSGSGLGRAGAGAIRGSLNPMTGIRPGMGMQGGYNPMMNGGYSQQPYGGGYR
ncbi:hypothetical protein ACFE04_012359 [Oxalis oulophora]